MNNLKNKIQEWINNEINENDKQFLEQKLQANKEKEIANNFDGSLEFGTAGLRGVLAPGPNRMNFSVVAKTTYGLAQVLKKENMTQGVVIGYDGRNKSKEFAELTAGILMSQNIKVYFFNDYSPTPLVAYSLKKVKASAGIVITASHNPPEYNGYKVYWNNGAQIISPIDKMIQEEILKSPAANKIQTISTDKLSNHSLFENKDELVNDYIKDISLLGQTDNRKIHPPETQNLVIAYTPLHGVGSKILEKTFHQNGFTNLHIVTSQEKPDGNFPTVNFPNPEEKGAMDLVIELAKKNQADIIIANDPDADRLAVAVLNNANEYYMLSGNEIGVIMGHYLLKLNQQNIEKCLVVNSVVSTSMLEDIAEKMGAHSTATLTGFKWIANTAMQLEEKNNWQFIYGFEEALGSTVSDLVRDKDGISAALVFAKMAAELKKQNSNVYNALMKIYSEYGLYLTYQKSIVLKGKEGSQKITEIMKSTRQQLTQIGKFHITKTIDVLKGNATLADGSISAIDLPSSDVMIFYLANSNTSNQTQQQSRHRIILRPSGTEPKIKIYIQTIVNINDSHENAQKNGQLIINELLKSIEKNFNI